MKAKFLNKSTLKNVNKALVTAGYTAYPGDQDSNGKRRGSGYVSNLLDYVRSSDRSKDQEIIEIIQDVVGN